MKNTEIIMFCALLFIGFKATQLNIEITNTKELIKPLKTKIKHQQDTIKYLRIHPQIMYKMDSIINTNRSTRNLKHKNKDLQELILKL